MPGPAPMNVAVDKQKYINAAKTTYQALKNVFAGGDFWICGHSFDTVIDYFQNVDAGDADDFARDEAINGYKPINDAWYDDFSWWGIACLKAATATVFSPENQNQFRKIALQAWSGMGLAAFGWVLCDQKTYMDFAPLFEGGIWNHIIDNPCNPGKPAPPKPKPDPYCGRQNTVTNLGYLVLATRLFLEKGPNNSIFKAAIDLEYGFLEAWRGFSDPEYRLEKFLIPPNPQYVVRERVGRFKKEGVVDPAYNPLWVWAGDQGLMLGALADRMRYVTTAPEYNKLLERARKLLQGSQEYLVKDKILRPWAPTDPDSGYQKDYWNGPAVYMRYLLWAFQHNSYLKEELQKDSLQTFLRDNADEVVKDPKRKQSGVAIVDLTNNLAMLVAAIAMLK